MNSECVSQIHPGGRDRGAVEGNCVAAMRGGEQPETDSWSQTKVNTIRHPARASLLAIGEACRASGKLVTVQGLPKLETGRVGCSWGGNDWKGAWDKWRTRTRCRREGSSAVRAFIVAMKPGNAGGAKGRRKMKTSKAVREVASSDCRKARTRSHVGAVPVQGRCLEAILGTGCSRPRGHLGPILLTAVVPRCDQPLPRRGALIDWRAGCGKSARPVRREGPVSSRLLPLSFRS